MENMVTSREFWSGRRVFVTGHTGFKGSWLALWLQSLGAQVTGYALAPVQGPSLFMDLGLADGMRSVEGDVRDLDRLQSVFSEAKPEVVFHLAAQSLVRPSYSDPVTTYATNVMGTVHLLEAARRLGDVQALVNVTSDKCYENREWVWGYREVDRMGGRDPYSNSKGCSELVTEAYRRSFFDEPGSTAIATARAGNVIGGGDWSTDRLVPDIVRAFTAERAADIRNPKAVRPWQHVLEPLGGYLLLAERLASAPDSHVGAWNFGPPADDGHSVGDVASRMATLWGGSARWSSDASDGLHEANLLRLDSTKARTRLNWLPRWSIDTALTRTVDWYRAHAARGDLRALTLDQISAYESDITG